MANITIYLKVDKVGHLHLRDTEGHSGEDDITTIAHDNDTITWTLDEDSNISKIENISAKEGSQNLFSQGPSRVTDTEWSGQISPTATGEESYYIEYYVVGDTKLKRDDPVIIIPPR